MTKQRSFTQQENTANKLVYCIDKIQYDGINEIFFISIQCIHTVSTSPYHCIITYIVKVPFSSLIHLHNLLDSNPVVLWITIIIAKLFP